ALVDVNKRPLLAPLPCRPRGAAPADGRDHPEGQVPLPHPLAGSVLVLLAGPDQLGFGDLDLRHLASQSSSAMMPSVRQRRRRSHSLQIAVSGSWVTTNSSAWMRRTTSSKYLPASSMRSGRYGKAIS